MKKIMFNDRYGLRSAVINGYKNMTRRNATALNHPNVCDISEWGIDKKGKVMLVITYDTGLQEVVYPHFQIGEVVAISQPYCEIEKEGFIVDSRYDAFRTADWNEETRTFGRLRNTAGYKNAMFVKADLMPHRIRITNIKAERLQDISEEDAMREGIHEGEFMNTWDKYYFDEWGDVPNHITFKTPRLAFQSLIDKVCKRGTWESNPWVYVYEFELV